MQNETCHVSCHRTLQLRPRVPCSYLPATVDISLVIVPEDGTFDFTACLPATVQQVRVHNKVVVRLQCRPEIVLSEAGVGGAALQAARAVAMATAPRPSPQFPLRVTFFLQKSKGNSYHSLRQPNAAPSVCLPSSCCTDDRCVACAGPFPTLPVALAEAASSAKAKV